MWWVKAHLGHDHFPSNEESVPLSISSDEPHSDEWHDGVIDGQRDE